jgi:hypothetical protein
VTLRCSTPRSSCRCCPRTCTPSLAHSSVHTHTRTHTKKHTNTHARIHTHTHTNTHARTLIHTQTHAHTHTHTHTHTHSQPLPPRLLGQEDHTVGVRPRARLGGPCFGTPRGTSRGTSLQRCRHQRSMECRVSDHYLGATTTFVGSGDSRGFQRIKDLNCEILVQQDSSFLRGWVGGVH